MAYQNNYKSLNSRNKRDSFNQINTTDQDDNIKLEVTSFLEYLLGKGIQICLCVILIILSTPGHFGAHFLNNCLFLLGFIAFCYFTSKHVNNYFIIDNDQKHLFNHFSIWGFEKITKVAHLSQIHGVTVSGVLHGYMLERRFWEYRIVIVLASKKVISISGVKEQNFVEQSQKAESIAHILDTKFIVPEPEKKARAKIGDDNNYSFEHQPLSLADSPFSFVISIIVITLVFIVLLLLH